MVTLSLKNLQGILDEKGRYYISIAILISTW